MKISSTPPVGRPFSTVLTCYPFSPMSVPSKLQRRVAVLNAILGDRSQAIVESIPQCRSNLQIAFATRHLHSTDVLGASVKRINLWIRMWRVTAFLSCLHRKSPSKFWHKWSLSSEMKERHPAMRFE